MTASNPEQVEATLGSAFLRMELRWDLKQVLGDKTPGFDVMFPPLETIDETTRRVVTRSIFSYIEATIFVTKAWVAAHRNVFPISSEELNFVREMSVEIDEKGELRSRRAKINLERNLLFMFGLLARVTGRQDKLKGTTGWDDFLTAIQVRDRWMHPKSLLALKVEDAEMNCVINGYHWLDGLIIAQEADADKIFEEAAKAAGIIY